MSMLLNPKMSVQTNSLSVTLVEIDTFYFFCVVFKEHKARDNIFVHYCVIRSIACVDVALLRLLGSIARSLSCAKLLLRLG